MPNAIEMLKKDHQKVKKLLGELADTTERATKTRKELLAQIETELSVHTTIEEEIFYPAFREAAQKKEHQKLVVEAFEEHRAVEALVLPDLKKTKVDSIEFSGRAKVLKELVEHHAEEEEQDMFPAAKKLLDEAELEELGQRMQERKNQLLKRKRAA